MALDIPEDRRKPLDFLGIKVHTVGVGLGAPHACNGWSLTADKLKVGEAAPLLLYGSTTSRCEVHQSFAEDTLVCSLDEKKL